MIIVLAIIACSKDNTFKKINTRNIDCERVIGIGSGESISPEMAKIKAHSNASLNLLNQVAGMSFSFKASDGSILFNTNAKGRLKNVKEIGSYQLKGNRYLVVLSADRNDSNIHYDNVIGLRKKITTCDIEMALQSQYKLAVEEIFSSSETQIDGKIFITNLVLDKKNHTEMFEIDLSFVICLNDN